MSAAPSPEFGTTHGDRNQALVELANERLSPFGGIISLQNGEVVDDEDGEAHRSTAAVLGLLGEYDLATGAAIHELLFGLVECNELVVLDLSETRLIDSTFLATLTSAHRFANQRGSHLRIQLGPEPSIVRTALRVAGLLDYLDCVIAA
jgi:anti-anti-sigma factor